MGFLADQNAANRQLTEEMIYRMRHLTFSNTSLSPEIPNLVYRRNNPGDLVNVRHFGSF